MSITLDKRDEQAFEELLKRIKRGECVLFLGAGASCEVGFPSGTDLALALARECNYPSTRPVSLSQVAQYYAYQTSRGRLGLFQHVRKLLECPVTTQELSSYDLIVEIEQLNHPIVTTNWDDQLEQAFRRKSKPVRVIRYNEQIASLPQPHAIVKLHGDFGNKPDEIVLTRDDYVKAYKQVTQPGGLFALLGTWLAVKTILFVGYSLEDEDFQLLYEHVTSAVGAGAPIHYAVMPGVEPSSKDFWRSRNIWILDCEALPFFEEVFVRTRRFVNREDELEYICTRATKPYIEIHGFAGCGKTELLREVADRYELTGMWVQAFVSFEDEQTSTEPLDLVAEIMQQTVGREMDHRHLMNRARAEIASEKEIEPVKVPESETKVRAAELAAEELGDYLARQRALLLFDSSERIPEPIVRWIESVLIPTLEEKVLDPQEQLRLVFAGRSPLPWRSPLVKKNLYVRPLTPFSEGAVGAMLDSFAALKLRDPLPKEKRIAIVKGVLDITSGHPRCIHNMLREIKDRKFDVSSDDFECEKERLFEEHVSPAVEEEILGKIEEDIRDIFRTVCVFRSLSADILDVLRQEGYVNEHFTDALTLLGRLRGTYLLGQPDPPPMYPIDPVVRRILAMSMELKSPERYHELNKLAMKTFEDLFAQAPMGELPVVYLNEALFHQLKLWIFEGQSSDEVKEQLQKTLEDYLGRLQPEEPHLRIPLLENLKYRLESDGELLDSMARLVPGDEYQALISPVERAIG